MTDPVPGKLEGVDDVYVVNVEHELTHEQAQRIKAVAQDALPGKKIIVLTGGITICHLASENAVKRIESKLDILIAALTEEQEPEPAPRPTLDGEHQGAERDQSQPL